VLKTAIFRLGQALFEENEEASAVGLRDVVRNFDSLDRGVRLKGMKKVSEPELSVSGLHDEFQVPLHR
jgi:hypothetical protein